MDKLDAMRLFKRVVESGSFSAVAREMGGSQSAVSKQIAALEAHLGTQLLWRNSRSMATTKAGQLFYESAVRITEEFEDASSQLRHGQTSPSGLIRVTTAPVFGRLHIVPKLPLFLERHPEISIELSSSERHLNLIDEAVDLAIRIGPLTDSSMVARSLPASPVVTVATPAYLAAHGTPQRPDELENHRCITFMLRQEARLWEYKNGPRVIVHRPEGQFRTADGEQVRAAVLADMGLAQVPLWLFSPEIDSGRVCTVLRGYEPDSIPISAVHLAGRRVPARLHVFIEYLSEIIR